jgi:protein phosphatase 1G
VANAGDSRAVLCRAGRALDLSVDHKPEDETERLRIYAAGGKITCDGRVNGGLNLSRALGDHHYKKNTTLPLEAQMISAEPDVTLYSIDRATDTFMVIACDGIW